VNILAITVPIYVVMAIGFLAGRAEVFSPPDMRVLGKFVVKFALPALLFTALSQRPITDILNGGYLAAYAGGSLAAFAAVAAFARFVRRKSVPHSVMIAMGSSFSNSGFVGYPIALQILGPPAAVALAMCMIVENVVMFPLVLVLAEMGGGDPKQRWQRVVLQSLGGLVRNPMIVAIFAGFIVSLFGIPLSEPLVRTVNMLAMASTALALFVIGGSLVGLDVKNVLGAVTAVALAKLLLHPAAVLTLLWLLPPIDPHLRMGAVIYAGMPMLSIYPILAQRYHFEGFCAAALLVATLLSFVTVTVVLWVLTSVLGWAP
jgi:predicted permease